MQLISSECPLLEWPGDERDNVVFVGSILPTSGLTQDLVVPFQNAMQLAIEDFNQTTTLQGDRKIAWVGCNSTGGSSVAVTAARHLVDVVGVPAIAGPLFTTVGVATQVTIDSDVVLVTPGGSTEEITALDDNDLVWSTLANDVYQANAMGDNLADEEPANVLMLAVGNVHGEGMMQTAIDRIGDRIAPEDIKTFTYGDPTSFASESEMLEAYQTTIASAFAELPQVYENPGDHYTHVVIFGTSEAVPLLWSYLGGWAQMQAAQPTLPLPKFYFTSGGVISMETAVNALGADPATEPLVPLKPLLLQQLEGVSPVVFNEANFQSFNIRYKIRYAEQDAVTVTSLSYDSMMSIMLAMATVPAGEEITGPKIAAAFPRLNDPDGAFVSFSGTELDFVTQARNALVAPNGSVDLQGVSGELDWDDRGGIRANAVHWHLQNVSQEQNGVEARLTQLRLYQLNDPPATDGVWDALD